MKRKVCHEFDKCQWTFFNNNTEQLTQDYVLLLIETNLVATSVSIVLNCHDVSWCSED